MRRKVEGMFEGDYKVVYHLAPPLLAKTDPLTGEPRKIRFGSWMGGVFKVLAALKGLRGTAFDLFGYTEERKTERALIREYEETVERLLAELSPQNHALAIQIASLPEEIRGYGHIKLKSAVAARKKQAELLAALGNRKKEKAAA
jgi:indolepyruvate ferredoxin oxidoreductase